MMNSHPAAKASALLLLGLLLLTGLAPRVDAQAVPTGQTGVCCAYILNSSNSWQLVCNNPTNVSHTLPCTAPADLLTGFHQIDSHFTLQLPS
jgi:hypothetical protein